jgi:uncharacterized protein YaiI (UPF0178 family)
MKLYIDGDAFPNLLKPIVTKQIMRLKLTTIVISNKPISISNADEIHYYIVKEGPDEADHKIVEMVEADDLVITADIPLADRVISKGAHAIDHRGIRYERENIKQYLAMRNLMAEIRESGEMVGGPKPFSKKDAQSFANQLNAFLSQRV